MKSLYGLFCRYFHRRHHRVLYDAIAPDGREYQVWTCAKCCDECWEVEG